ncbi:MAG: hypothetical protein RSA21_02285 [Akkermansia sp.]
MKNLDRFTFAGMVSCSAPSDNKVGYFSPTVIDTEIETGLISIQSLVEVKENACLCANNGGFVIGVVNPNSGHIHPGKVTVQRGGWIGYIGNKKGVIMELGKDADGSLIIDGGRALFAKGEIAGSSKVISSIVVNEGALDAGEIMLQNPHSSIKLRHGFIHAGKLGGGFKVWIYGGLMAIEGKMETGLINLTGKGALVFGCGKNAVTANMMSQQGINFVGDGGTLIVKIHNHQGALSKTYDAEALFDDLMKSGKISRDGCPIDNFSGFHMEKLMGKNEQSFALLRPVPDGESKAHLIKGIVRSLLYGSTRQKYDL